MASVAEIAFDLSRSSLAEQERSMAELRARTGTLLAAASLVASFLGSRALGPRGTHGVEVAAGIAFGVCIAACVYVLAPKRDLIFAVRGSAAYEELYGSDDDEAYRRLSYWLDEFREQNERAVNAMQWAFWVAIAGLAVEVILLGLDLTI